MANKCWRPAIVQDSWRIEYRNVLVREYGNSFTETRPQGPSIMTELKKWKLACLKGELNLIFSNGEGKPMNYSNMVNRHFKPAIKTAGVPDIRFHDLRHTYASLMIEQGENLKYIQSQLGHSSPTVTLNVYSHLMKSVNQEAALRLENAIFEINGSKMVADNRKGL